MAGWEPRFHNASITATTRDLKSMTLGVNLDHDLRPIAATIISLNKEPFRGSSMLQKLFGSRDEFQGISPLHTVPPKTATTADGRIFATTVPGDPLIYQSLTNSSVPVESMCRFMTHPDLICSQVFRVPGIIRE